MVFNNTFVAKQVHGWYHYFQERNVWSTETKVQKKHMLLVVKILQKNYVIILDHDDHRNYIKWI